MFDFIPFVENQTLNINSRTNNNELRDINIFYNINDSVQSIAISLLKMVAGVDGAMI